MLKMLLQQKLRKLTMFITPLIFLVVLVAVNFLATSRISAQTPPPVDQAALCVESGGTWDEATETCPGYVSHDCEGASLVAGASLNDENRCGILDYIVTIINVLSAVAGIIIVISIIYGGILYSSAGSDPQKVAAAKARIRNAIIALLLFIFGVGLLNYLVPGGVLG